MLETTALHAKRTEATPEQAGYDPAVLERLHAHYAELIAKGTIQGASYLLSRRGKTFAHASMGKLAPEENGADLLPDSVRKTYSITKMFTAAAIMQQIERGSLYLEQPVSTILKPFDTDLHRHITVFDLLTHTSGLRGDPGFLLEPHQLPWFEWGYHERKKIDPSTDWIQIALTGPLAGKRGKDWIYCSAGYAILAEIVSRVSGVPYHQYTMDEIVKPLGMDRTFFLVPPEMKDEVCVTNDWERSGLAAAEYPPGEPPKGGNGLYSSLADLERFGRMLLNGGTLEGARILSKRSVEMLTRNQLSGVRMKGWGNDEPDFRFGLGLSLDSGDVCTPGTFGHEGHGHCGLYVDPAEEFVFAFFVPGKKGFTMESVVAPRAIVWSGLL